jgi:hypothetical protein
MKDKIKNTEIHVLGVYVANSSNDIIRIHTSPFTPPSSSPPQLPLPLQTSWEEHAPAQAFPASFKLDVHWPKLNNAPFPEPITVS